LDAHLIIRDGQGTAKAYADYLRASQIDREAAAQRGFLSRAEERSGFKIGRGRSDDHFVALANGVIDEQQAPAIAGAACAKGLVGIGRQAAAARQNVSSSQLL
jgi:hypothetical protein